MSENVYPKANEGGETAHVAPNPSFPDMEETVLDYWDKDDTFLLRTVCRTTATC